jgi:hypothetical protein
MGTKHFPAKLLAVIPFLILFNNACNSLDDNQKQIAAETGQAQVTATDDDLVTRTNQLNDELKTRQRFFQGVSGIFEGQAPWSVAGTPVKSLATRITISPTVPEYADDRERTYEELNADLVALALNVQVDEAADTGGQTGCIFNSVRPDMVSGEIRLISSSCPTSYTLWIVPQGTDASQEDPSDLSQNSGAVAQSILSGATTSAFSFQVQMDSTQAAQIVNFAVSRTDTP